MDKATQQYLLNLVKRNYEKIAEDFDITRKKHIELSPELISIIQKIKNNQTILDVGCGNGRLLKAFQNKKINYIGIDNSKKLLKLAREQWTSKLTPSTPTLSGRSDLQNSKFILGNILELDKLQEKDFDYIFCLAVLHHLPGQDLRLVALKQLKNKINQHGKIIITVWNMLPQKKFRKLLFKFTLLKIIRKSKMDFGDVLFNWKDNVGQAISRRYYHIFIKQELIKIFKKAGLKVEKLYKDKYNYCAVLNK
ncbi:MAG: methyltransferase domain-containing protein [Patescibacteria group bacterium]|nr:class I SAM-dependent methyltransferase [Patescibacteria group bacterium]MBU1870804.1 class I SAM-dependent methyltransferase [Patescibacteria group bacterium]